MNNHTYHPGDRVLVTTLCSYPALRGQLADVVEMRGSDDVRVRFDDGEHFTLMIRSIELVSAPSIPAPTALMSALPHDSAERKTYPLMSAFIDYFPSAMAAVAKHSYENNEKHNPGETVHWSRGKSADHLDAAARHLMERDLVGLAWRAMAALQMELEGEGHAVAPAAR